MDSFMPDFWYLVVAGRAVAPGRTVPATLLGQDILVGRARDGTVFAYADRCPHRGMPMRHGGFDGEALQCGYHGWRFRAQDGRCVSIPALAERDTIDPARFTLRGFACREVQGNIWVYPGEAAGSGAAGDRAAGDRAAGDRAAGDRAAGDGGAHGAAGVADTLPPVPTVPGFEGTAPQVSAVMRFPCPADVATMGFIDPAHPAFVHTSRWWKRRPSTSLRAKEKAFEPDALGFRMKRHHLRHGANPYRLLGRNVHVDVTIQLPGLRIEHIQGERHSACVLAMSTPVGPERTDVHYCVWWSMGWLALARPAARWMARDFLRQDHDVAVQLQEGGAPFPPPMFVGDADAQIRWFLRVKKEYQASRTERRAFANPLREQVLQWRS